MKGEGGHDAECKDGGMAALREHRIAAEVGMTEARRALAAIRKEKKRGGGIGGRASGDDDRGAISMEMATACLCCKLAAEHYVAAREHMSSVDRAEAHDELEGARVASKAAYKAAHAAVKAGGIVNIIGALGTLALELRPEYENSSVKAHRDARERRRKARGPWRRDELN